MKLNKKNLLFFVCGLVTILIVLIILIYNTIDNSSKNSNKSKEHMELKFENRIKDLENFDSGKYYKIGWLQVQGTNIDFAILDSSSQLGDIKYSFGWLSPTYVTGENREVLLGHNVLNVSSTPMLSDDNLQDFESLMSFSYFDFAEKNLYIQYTKNGKNELYLIYAIGFYDYNVDNGESFSNEKLLKEYITNIRKNSIYDYDIDVNSSDKLLTLKTCTRYFGLNEKQQFIIDARKVRDNEEILKYKVEKNENYNQLLDSVEIN